MEGLEVSREFWEDKRVFLTGHTGFKGSWLALWLTDMGAQVHGYALPPPTTPNIFAICDLQAQLRTSTIADIRNVATLVQTMQDIRPDIVLHLAAQPLVRYSYSAPLETYEVNVMGTANLLEAVRHTTGVKAVVNITSDKCYENRDWVWPYRENDPLGGFDPYSSSKGCAELVTAAYRRSYLERAGTHLASARAGNVIGGGDWAAGRLIPDFLRAVDADQSLIVRSPQATRPWQHVLDPLAGYLTLAEKLCTEGGEYAEAWNFGPPETGARSVQWMVEYLCARVSGTVWRHDHSPQPHEANHLKLDSSKANAKLGWHPRWNLETALDRTLNWHQAWKRGVDMREISLAQIDDYENGTGSAPSWRE